MSNFQVNFIELGGKYLKQLKAQTLFERVGEIKDPRVERTKLHLLKDILVMAVWATIR